MLKKPSHNCNEGESDERNKGSSLDRLAEFTRAIVAVPKSELPSKKRHKGKKTRSSR